MTLYEFAEITRRVIARDGFEGYLPTACFPERRHVAVLEGVPNDVDIERAALAWAADKACEAEEYLVAFKIESTRFKVVRRAGEIFEEASFEVNQAS